MVEGAWTILVRLVLRAREARGVIGSRACRVGNTVLVVRYSARATEVDRLSAGISLDRADLPTADQEIQSTILIQPFSAFAEWKLIEITEGELIGQVLNADRLVLPEVRGVRRLLTLIVAGVAERDQPNPHP